jgi:hypothetical protein
VKMGMSSTSGRAVETSSTWRGGARPAVGGGHRGGSQSGREELDGQRRKIESTTKAEKARLYTRSNRRTRGTKEGDHRRGSQHGGVQVALCMHP